MLISGIVINLWLTGLIIGSNCMCKKEVLIENRKSDAVVFVCEGNAFELCSTVKCCFCDVFYSLFQSRDAVVGCISVKFLY